MDIAQLAILLEGHLVTQCKKNDISVEHGFTSDLMSDVLTIPSTENLVLITGLANPQTIRTAEMAGINVVILVRGKKSTKEMISIAEDNDIIIIETPFSAFHTSATLFNNGVTPLY